MNKQPFLTLIFVFLGLSISSTFAQDSTKKATFKLTNSKTIDANRYDGIKGSPFLFNEYVYANIITNDLIEYEGAKLDFNGKTKEFEVSQDGKFIELDRKFYLRVEIPADKNKKGIVPKGQEKLVFQKNLHPKFGDRMLIMIHLGKKVMAAKEFHCAISEKEKQDVGKTIITKRFFRKFNYYLIMNGELNSFKTNKKSLIKILGSKKELESFIKNNKYKVDKEEDLKEILAYYETL